MGGSRLNADVFLLAKSYDVVLGERDHTESGRNRASSRDPDGLPARSSPDLTCASSLCKPGFLGKDSSIGSTAPSASAPPSCKMKGSHAAARATKDTLDHRTLAKGPKEAAGRLAHRDLMQKEPHARSKRRRLCSVLPVCVPRRTTDVSQREWALRMRPTTCQRRSRHETQSPKRT